ncbi:hypothetical protein E2C01_049931 [Portunus trituberculatus]|uniref:Uncharacterized protein n=1 Tax=Portunus trituberculatus TaxID=210409 RepID=A0A5B7GAR3_PORTR|nr:hypothetical protein [Portunus trituberculatus]
MIKKSHPTSLVTKVTSSDQAHSQDQSVVEGGQGEPSLGPWVKMQPGVTIGTLPHTPSYKVACSCSPTPSWAATSFLSASKGPVSHDPPMATAFCLRADSPTLDLSFMAITRPCSIYSALYILGGRAQGPRCLQGLTQHISLEKQDWPPPGPEVGNEKNPSLVGYPLGRFAKIYNMADLEEQLFKAIYMALNGAYKDSSYVVANLQAWKREVYLSHLKPTFSQVERGIFWRDSCRMSDQRLEGWLWIGAEKWVLDVLWEGYRIPFSALLPLISHFKDLRDYAQDLSKDKPFSWSSRN